MLLHILPEQWRRHLYLNGVKKIPTLYVMITENQKQIRDVRA
jgi:hypothetical protein